MVAGANLNLNTTQSLLDLTHALTSLDATVSGVFDGIIERVTKEHGRIGALQNRLSSVDAKVKAVVGSTSANRIFSAAKFPAAKKLPEDASLFVTDLEGLQQQEAPERDADDEHVQLGDRNLSAATPEGVHQLMDLYTRLHIHDPSSNKQTSKVEFRMEAEGLGRLPVDVQDIGGLLLFNSTQTPFKTYHFQKYTFPQTQLSITGFQSVHVTPAEGP